MPWRTLPDMPNPARLATLGIVLYGFVVGWRILTAEPIRFSGPGYTILRKIPGGMDTWGWAAIFCAAAVLMCYVSGRWWPRAGALLLLSVWAGSFGATSLYTEQHVPNAGPVGGPTFMLVAFLAAVLIGYRGPRDHRTSP